MRGPRTAMKSGPLLPQLEKALAQKRRPNIAINQSINQSILKKKKVQSEDFSKQEAYMINYSYINNQAKFIEARLILQTN